MRSKRGVRGHGLTTPERDERAERSRALKTDLVTIRDLDAATIHGLLDLAARLAAGAPPPATAPRILATLFYEPSTRTRLSFESAMLRLGGQCVSMADARSSSAVKGESLADAARIVGAYADVVVIRHPAAGAARLAAEKTAVPVINAGDGGHEHPTQTLVDLYTLRAKRGRLDGLRVLLYGDLLHGRTTHSLADALVRLGGDVYLLAEPGLEMPAWVIERCVAGGAVCRELDDASGPWGRGPRLHVLSRRPGAAEAAGALPPLDALYVTRLQRERLDGDGRARAVTLPRVDRSLLDHVRLRDAIVMHPLPRVGEIDPAIDDDVRAAYFDQAAAGVPVRMAILAALLAPDRAGLRFGTGGEARTAGPRCTAPQCIAAAEPDAVLSRNAVRAHGRTRCAYCEGVLEAAASSP